MEPPFLTHDWKDEHFPQAENASYEVPYKEWDDGYDECTPCLSYMEWAGLWRGTPLYRRSAGVIPGHLFTAVRPRLLRYPAGQRDERRGEYYRQQVITSTDLYWRNIFTDPVQQDMVYHSSTEIPLRPTGRAASLKMDYLLDVQFDRLGQNFSLQLAGEMDQVLKVDIYVQDGQVKIDTAVNHRRVNHIGNNSWYALDDERYYHYDME